MAKLTEIIEVFVAYVSEAIFLAISLGIFSLVLKGNSIYPFLNGPLDWNNDLVIEFYILFFLGGIFLLIYGIIKTMTHFRYSRLNK